MNSKLISVSSSLSILLFTANKFLDINKMRDEGTGKRTPKPNKEHAVKVELDKLLWI